MVSFALLVFFFFCITPTHTYITTITDNGIEVNFPCAPRPIIQDTTNTVHRAYTPRNLKLFRCSGFTGQPETTRNMKCVAVKKSQLQLEYSSNLGKLKQVKQFENHTRCEMRCVCTLNGNKCTRDDLFHDVPCDGRNKWSTGTCQCVPAPPSDDNSSPCVDCKGEQGVGVGVLVFALVGEAFVLVLILFLVKKCRAKTVEEDRELRDVLAADALYRN